METTTLNNLVRALEVFYDQVIFFTTGCVLIRIGEVFRKRVLTILTCLTLNYYINLFMIAV